jgi:transaldolase
MAASKLAQLRSMTSVVADTGDIDAIRLHQPDDATTNPSLILKAVESSAYAALVDEALSRLAKSGKTATPARVADYLAVRIGKEITGVVAGRISTEVDARLSFDSAATYAKAQELVDLYDSMGVGKERILIKVAATWEGIRAAERLEREGIRCNLTLLFSFAQAVACAEAGAYLISPFVGRIYDWYKTRLKRESLAPHEDPGVQSVKRIYTYYKQHGYETIVMGASFRHTGQIEALAGCDKLTISPELLLQLEHEQGTLERQLQPDSCMADRQRNGSAPGKPASGRLPRTLTEAVFRWEHNEDAMATEKLAEGIRKFAEDQIKLETLLQHRMNEL